MGDALVSYLAFSQNPTTSGTLLVRKKVREWDVHGACIPPLARLFDGIAL